MIYEVILENGRVLHRTADPLNANAYIGGFFLGVFQAGLASRLSPVVLLEAVVRDGPMQTREMLQMFAPYEIGSLN